MCMPTDGVLFEIKEPRLCWKMFLNAGKTQLLRNPIYRSDSVSGSTHPSCLVGGRVMSAYPRIECYGSTGELMLTERGHHVFYTQASARRYFILSKFTVGSIKPVLAWGSAYKFTSGLTDESKIEGAAVEFVCAAEME